jgi:hypothetical protein
LARHRNLGVIFSLCNASKVENFSSSFLRRSSLKLKLQIQNNFNTTKVFIVQRHNKCSGLRYLTDPHSICAYFLIRIPKVDPESFFFHISGKKTFRYPVLLTSWGWGPISNVCKIFKYVAFCSGMPSTHSMVGFAVPATVVYVTMDKYEFPLYIAIIVSW